MKTIVQLVESVVVSNVFDYSHLRHTCRVPKGWGSLLQAVISPGLVKVERTLKLSRLTPCSHSYSGHQLHPQRLVREDATAVVLERL